MSTGGTFAEGGIRPEDLGDGGVIQLFWAVWGRREVAGTRGRSDAMGDAVGGGDEIVMLAAATGVAGARFRMPNP